MIRLFTILVASLSMQTAGCMTSETVTNSELACARATSRVSAVRQRPVSHVAVCEANETGNPAGYYIVALRGHCREELCGSTLIGWFAVRRSDGAVLEFEVGEGKVGRPVSAQTFGG